MIMAMWEEVIFNDIASVFCSLGYRRRGYAARYMTELAKTFFTWQSDQARVADSVCTRISAKSLIPTLDGNSMLPTDLGSFSQKKIYRGLFSVQELVADDLEELCKRDEAMVRGKPAANAKKLITILFDLDHMLWHIGKEKLVTERLFGKRPRAKGAIAGPSGGQVWAIWTHRYYAHPNVETSSNTLYILRLVVEDDDAANKPPSTGEIVFQTDEHSRQVDSLIAFP